MQVVYCIWVVYRKISHWDCDFSVCNKWDVHGMSNFKTINAMVTKLTQDDVDNNSSNFRCFVDMLT